MKHRQPRVQQRKKTSRSLALTTGEPLVSWTTADLTRVALKQLKKSELPSRRSNHLRVVLKSLSRMRLPKAKEIILEVPAEIGRQISLGTLKRTGGVIRDTKRRSVVHLKDASKLKRALKGPVLPLMLLDFAEGALLNEKLEQIQEQLTIAIEKSEQMQRAKLAVPFEKLSNLHHLDSSEARSTELGSINDAIDEAITMARERTAGAKQRAAGAANVYGKKSYFPFADRGKKREQAFSAAEQFCNDSEIMLALIALRARVHEELGNSRAAIAASELALEFTAGAVATLNELGGHASVLRRVDHLKGPFVGRSRIQRAVKEQADNIMSSSTRLLNAALVQFTTRGSSPDRLQQHVKQPKAC